MTAPRAPRLLALIGLAACSDEPAPPGGPDPARPPADSSPTDPTADPSDPDDRSLLAAMPRPDCSRVAEPLLRDQITEAQAAIEAAPRSASAWSTYAAILGSHDWKLEAAGAFRVAELLDPREFRWPYLQGTLLAGLEPERALAAFERAIAIDGAWAPAHVYVGKLLGELQQHERAERSFGRAIALDDGLSEAWLAWGQLLLAQRDPAAAEHKLRQALAIDPSHPEVRSALAAACFQLGRKDEAAEHARVAAANAQSFLYPADPRAAIVAPPATAADFLAAGIALAEQQRFDEAIEHLRKSTAIDPDEPSAWTNLARTLGLTGEYAAAEDAARRGLAVAESAAGQEVLGRALLAQGATDEGIARLRRAVELTPDDLRLRSDLGAFLLDAGRIDDAIATIDAVLAVAPDHARAAIVARELAFRLATSEQEDVRDGVEALRLAELVAPGRGDDPDFVDARTAALAECGRFEEAARLVEEFLARAREAGREKGVKRLERRLQRYRNGRPMRVAPGEDEDG